MRDSDLEQAFGQFGAVASAKVMIERDTGINGQSLGGRSVIINEARRMESRPPRTRGCDGRRLWRSGGRGGGDGGFRRPYGTGPRGGGGGNRSGY